jgi:uncharacterized protein
VISTNTLELVDVKVEKRPGKTDHLASTRLALIPPELPCRVGCGACCIAPSISSPIPGMPDGKPGGVRCLQLTADNRCRLFGSPERPAVCSGLQPSHEMCGQTNEEAIAFLNHLEQLTKPTLTLIHRDDLPCLIDCLDSGGDVASTP